MGYHYGIHRAFGTLLKKLAEGLELSLEAFDLHLEGKIAITEKWSFAWKKRWISLPRFGNKGRRTSETI
ncbi:hypothetical protein ADIS_1974 [Lunatimonas lonarensis]|uniref:Uncharacterized protein n=1 Tax=Lunatimonas lonarensis TaxID=1232681 RepID=R7ZTV3_9BACT|nr:hypothetical protein ADIS_1974 [Lunatimonas lonarensis]